MTTPNNITKLKDNEIFVFGSNLNGSHGGGAALLAKQSFGAVDGVGDGITGQCYAFPTLDKKMNKVSKKALLESKVKLYKYAEENPDKKFLVTKLGCGIAGFSEKEMIAVFKGEKPSNVILPVGWSVVKGYKAFEKGMICRGFQYELGKDFYHKAEIVPCGSGFHFCKNLSDVYSYYNYRDAIVVGEIESEGEVIDEENKSVTNHIRITRLLGKVEASNNNGKENVGHSNTGHSNTGHWNTGHWNTGDRNTGDRNTGDRNTGDRNTGHWNTGHWNTGDRNTGDSNTGDRNTGHWNTGHWNTGDRNTGHWNTGHWNTGHWNTGHSNTGDRNTGHSNTGHWNTASCHVGSFNTEEVKEILVFNKKCKKDVWDKADKPYCLYFNTKQWIYFEDMTDEEKVKNPSAKTCGGYLKTLEYKEAFKKSMENASPSDIEKVKKLPNFNKKVFFEISGFLIK